MYMVLISEYVVVQDDDLHSHLCTQTSVHESSLLEGHPPFTGNIAIGVEDIDQAQR